MTQINSIETIKTSANAADYLVLQPPGGVTYRIKVSDFLAGLSSGGTATPIPPVTPSLDPSIIHLLKFNGADNSVNFMDEVGTILGVYGTPKIKTDISKFDGASGLFSRNTLDYIVLPHVNLSGEFRIESWVYLTSAFDDYIGICGQGGIQLGAYGGNLYFWQNYGFTYSFMQNPVLNAWTHVAVSRVAGIVRLFMNGNLVSTQANTSDLSSSGDFEIGRASIGGKYWNGNLDNFCIAVGNGKYTDSFVPSLSVSGIG